MPPFLVVLLLSGGDRTTLFMSSSLGFASGVLIATIAFEMMPKAIELGSVIIATGGLAPALERSMRSTSSCITGVWPAARRSSAAQSSFSTGGGAPELGRLQSLRAARAWRN